MQVVLSLTAIRTAVGDQMGNLRAGLLSAVCCSRAAMPGHGSQLQLEAYEYQMLRSGCSDFANFHW